MIDNREGKIVILASMLGGLGVPGYAASKGGIAQAHKGARERVCQHGVNVNADAPGCVVIDMNEALHADKERNSQISAPIPAHRWGTPGGSRPLSGFRCLPTPHARQGGRRGQRSARQIGRFAAVARQNLMRAQRLGWTAAICRPQRQKAVIAARYLPPGFTLTDDLGSSLGFSRPFARPHCWHSETHQ